MKIKFKLSFFLVFLFVSSSLSHAQSIAINEFMSSNNTTIADEDGDFEDWIEIYNYGSTTVNLSGFGLSDQVDNPLKWVFPNKDIAPNTYLIIWASDKNRTPSSGELHTNFKIKSGGEALVLSNASGTILSDSPAVSLVSDQTYGRVPNGTGNWTFLEEPTPGESNSNATDDEVQKVAINEFMSLNESIYPDEDGDFVDWIEIYNYGEEIVNLTGFGLSDDNTMPFKWVFPDVNLAPGAFMVVFASGKDRTTAGNQLHTNFGIGAGGETLRLTNPNGVLVSGSPSVSLEVDTSYGRQPDGTGSWLFFDTPTPLAPNTGSGNTVSLEPPVFSHNSGYYASAFDLSLTTDVQNATIVYTLDGSEPDISNLDGSTFTFKNDYPGVPGEAFGELLTESYVSNQYNGPISITDRSAEPNRLVSKNANQFDHYIPPSLVRKATVVRAKVYSGGKGSKTASKTFFLWPDGNPYHIPVFSFQIPEKYLFDYNIGIYTAGIDFDTWRQNNPDNNQSWRPEINNFSRRGREWEYLSNVELFQPTSMESIQNIDVGFRIHGNNSRIGIVKNLRLYPRNEYDETNEISHELFDETILNAKYPYNNEYRRVMLRGDGAGGSVSYDVAFSRLMQPVYQGVTRIKPAIHFMNGEYWGITAIRDRFDEFHYEKFFGTNPDNFVQISCNGSKCEQDDEGEDGDYELFTDMLDFIIDNDMSDDQKYNEAKEILDIETFIDHAIMIIFASNNSYERKFWRARNKADDEYNDGKWRVSSQDYEASLSNFDWLEYLGDVNRSRNSALLANLLENQNFRNRFINRFSDLLNTIFQTGHFSKIIEEVFTEIDPYLAEDKNRANRDDFYETNERTALLEWAIERPDEQRNILQSYFTLGNLAELTLNLSEDNAGFIAINTIDIKSSTPGVDAEAYPWQGIYFEGVPVSLEAFAYPGYTFTGWSGSINSTNKNITVDLNGDTNIVANYERQSDFEHLAYFWLFDDNIENDTPLASIESTYSRYDIKATLNFSSALEGYPFTAASDNWRKASMERKNSPTEVNYNPFANDDKPYNENLIRGIQIKQPFQVDNRENTIELELNTFNFSDIKLAFAVKSNGAAQSLIVDYWNGSNWIASNINSLLDISNIYERKEVDFSAVNIANNNENFKVRFRFDGEDMSADDGKEVVFNNISISGVEGTLSSEDNQVFTNDLNVKVFPNPTNSHITVLSDQLIDKVALYNLLGQTVFSSTTDNFDTSIDMTQFKDGVYQLRIFSGNAITLKKIIKH